MHNNRQQCLLFFFARDLGSALAPAAKTFPSRTQNQMAFGES
jgi:hypothetical protein